MFTPSYTSWGVYPAVRLPDPPRQRYLTVTSCQSAAQRVEETVLLHRARRKLRLAGALALAGGSLFAGGGPVVAAGTAANVVIKPMIINKFISADQPISEQQCQQDWTVSCYQPSQIQAAYNELPLLNSGINGAGETIVLVDAFGSPTIQSDLATFDSTFGLSAPPSFKIIQPAGKVAPFNPNNADEVTWAQETSLDVEWSHVMAPGANILLVETPLAADGLPEIVEAENYVINHHLGQVISQSFGLSEESFPSAASIYAMRSAYTNALKNHVTVLASSGDEGAANLFSLAGTARSTYPTVQWPASDPLVTAVGGTQLALFVSGQRAQADRVWDNSVNYAFNNDFKDSPGPYAWATGGGVSAVFSRPSYQDGVSSVTGDHRGVPDISMSGACDGPVETYQGFPGQSAGWYISCGTSESSPLFAGILALADQEAGHSLGFINPALYALSAEHAPGIVDVTQGNNTVSFVQDNHLVTVQGYHAGPGYDLASGVGTVNAALFVPELVAQATGGGSYSG
jgi:subtilase family serine protease